MFLNINLLDFDNLQADANLYIPLQVYINRSGQELTGQSAYRQYRKVHLNTPTFMILVHLMSVKFTLNILGYRRVEQGGLGSQKRKLAPRSEKAEARHLRILSIYYLQLVECTWRTCIVSGSSHEIPTSL